MKISIQKQKPRIENVRDKILVLEYQLREHYSYLRACEDELDKTLGE